MRRNNNIESLSGDMLSDDFIRIFQPVFLILRVMGLLRVNIMFRYPTAPTILYQLYSIAFWLFNMACVAYYLLNCENVFESQYAKSTLKIGVIMNAINGTLLTFRNNSYKSNKMGQMFVKLQKIERCLKMKNSTSSNKQFSNQTSLLVWISGALSIFWLLILNGLFMQRTCAALLVTLFMGVAIHIEVAQGTFIIRLITVRVNYINNLLHEKSIATKKSLQNSLSERKLFYLNSAGMTENGTLGDLVPAMHCILDTLADFTELFQFSVSGLTELSQ